MKVGQDFDRPEYKDRASLVKRMLNYEVLKKPLRNIKLVGECSASRRRQDDELGRQLGCWVRQGSEKKVMD